MTLLYVPQYRAPSQYIGILIICTRKRLVSILGYLAPSVFGEGAIKGFSFIRMQVLYFLSNFDGYFFCIPNKNVNTIGHKRQDSFLTVIEIKGS